MVVGDLLATVTDGWHFIPSRVRTRVLSIVPGILADADDIVEQ